MKTALHTNAAFLTLAALSLLCATSEASTYGTLTNFDTVNVCEVETHGFEIELEDCHSSDISRTYNYNHYGVPNISDDDSVPGHPVCYIKWESSKNPDGSWAAYTAIPAGPIPATNGHMFTNPNINFGGEHFGVSYRTVPTNVRYFWLIDDGAGNLIRSCQVHVSVPTYTYNPVIRQVVARVEPVEPPEIEVPVDQFGEATWVKSIKTTTHNDKEMKVKDLVSDDPDDPDDINWRNGEPAEVETEWSLLQEEFDGDGVGGGDEEAGGPEDLPDGDEIVTRRWEYYEYTGPYDIENHEAIANEVAPDNMHGVGTSTAAGEFYDLENTIVVGEFLGAQMAAFDVDAELGLIDHLQDGEIGADYPERTVVMSGVGPFTATCTGALPAGMAFNDVTGVVSGTPTSSGDFAVTVEASDAQTPLKSRIYNFRVAAAGVALPPRSTIETSVAHAGRGTTIGGGPINNGTMATIVATASGGYEFDHWSDGGAVVSNSSSYQFNVAINRALAANFKVANPKLDITQNPDGSSLIEWPLNPLGWVLQEKPDPASGAPWQNSAIPIVMSDGMHTATLPPGAGPRFFRLCLP